MDIECGESERNVEKLVEAFAQVSAQHQDAELVVVGDGPHLDALKALAKGHPVVFTGFLEGEALSKAYSGADVFVFPSMTDTFGNVVLEAQASGLPAIVADRGGPAEIVEHERTGLVVDASRAEMMANAMMRLMQNREERSRMAQDARCAAEANSWEAAARRFIQHKEA